jgi:hypothetical protein
LLKNQLMEIWRRQRGIVSPTSRRFSHHGCRTK